VTVGETTDSTTEDRPVGAGKADLAALADTTTRIRRAVESVIEGKRDTVRLAITVMLAEGHLLIEDVPGVGKTMLDALKKLQEKYRFIGDVRGRGLMIGVEMVADRKTKEPLDKAITLALFHEALARGLVTMSYSHVIRINPPLVITEDEALRGVDILDQSFGAIARQFGLD